MAKRCKVAQYDNSSNPSLTSVTDVVKGQLFITCVNNFVKTAFF